MVGPSHVSSTDPVSGALARPRRVTVLGATGSVGRSTADILARRPDLFSVEALVANRSVDRLAEMAVALRARIAVVADADRLAELRARLAGTGIEAAAGEAAVVEAATRPVDLVVGAIVGAAGLEATLAAVRRGTAVALANKECLVCAGHLFMAEAQASGATILSIDSEHNAIFQALGAGPREGVTGITLTASGGPFRTWSAADLARARAGDALKHPTWSMGDKITIDSATLMNKGLELIEAHHLFSIAPDRLHVVVHPQSVVHGLVTFADGGVVAGLAAPDMRIPIAHALAWPDRLDWPAPGLDLARIGSLTFEEPDLVRFPCLRIARDVLASGGARPTVLNAANEVAVAAFLEGRIGFRDVAAVVEATLDALEPTGLAAAPATLADARNIDHVARSCARVNLREIASKAS